MASSSLPTTNAPDELQGRIISSMTWSAWADAVGFISELTDERGLRTRTRNRPLEGTMAWKRRVGGRFGVQIDLPAGCYSDDTQLRLAVSRSISAAGFDVEAFARVELTVWPSYALGGGRASKAAAAAMTKPNATWSTNFYPGWTESGGNGAAMRIQPHVWASTDLPSGSYLDDVVRDAVVTHGHPRAIIGAVLHAAALAHALTYGTVPEPADWSTLLDVCRGALSVFQRDIQLAHFWRPQWERETGRLFADVWNEIISECSVLLAHAVSAREMLSSSSTGDPAEHDHNYERIVTLLDLRNEKIRGSGTSTVIAALLLASALSRSPKDVALASARALGTDTDTIGTMAAALVGAVVDLDLPSPLQDDAYLRNEAIRLHRISLHEPTRPFPYPDLLRWTPPRTQLDCVGTVEDEPALAGLGTLEVLSPTIESKDAGWTWMRTSFGPTVLIKHRLQLKPLSLGNWPQPARPNQTAGRPPDKITAPGAAKTASVELDLFPEESNTTRSPMSMASNGTPKQRTASRGTNVDIEEVLNWLQRNAYDDQKVGYAVKRVAQIGSSEQMGILFGALRTALRKND